MPSLLRCFSCLGLGSLHSWRRRNQHPTRSHLTVAMHHLLTGIIHYALLIPNTSYSNSGFHPISYTRTILNRILCPQIPNSAERKVLRFGVVSNFKYFSLLFSPSDVISRRVLNVRVFLGSYLKKLPRNKEVIKFIPKSIRTPCFFRCSIVLLSRT